MAQIIEILFQAVLQGAAYDAFTEWLGERSPVVRETLSFGLLVLLGATVYLGWHLAKSGVPLAGSLATGAYKKHRDSRRYSKRNRYGVESVKDLMVFRIESNKRYQKKFGEVLAAYLDKQLPERPHPSSIDFSTMISLDHLLSQSDSREDRIAIIKHEVNRIIDQCVQSKDLKTEYHIHATTVFKYDFDQWCKKMRLPKLKAWSRIPTA